MSIGIGPGIGVGIGGSVGGAGGGTGFPSSLTAAANGPILSISGGLTSYPPVLTVDLLYGVQTVGDTMRVVAASDVAFTTILLDDNFTLTGVPATDTAALNSALAPLNSAAVRYIRVHCIGWSNVVMHGNATPATITSSATPSVDELAPLAHALTANQPIMSWDIVSGEDYPYFLINGSTLSWSGGYGDYEVKASYTVVVRATNLAGLTTDQIITLGLNDIDEIPDGVSFTPVADAALSTPYESNTVTVTGVASGINVSATVSGAEWRKNGGTYQAPGALTVALNDTLQLRRTSAGTNGTQLLSTVAWAGVTSNWTITTPVDLGIPQSAGVGLYVRADDSATLFTNVDATGTVNNGSSIGTWFDKSANGFHLSAADNDTRPTFNANGGFPRVDFDGVNDCLRRLAGLSLYTASGYTAAIALRSNANAVNRYLVAGGNATQTNTIFSLFGSYPVTAADATTTYRNDAGAALSGTGLVLSSAAFDDTDTVLIVVDTGTTLTMWQDGVAGTTRTYTRTGNMTIDRFAIGALFRVATAGSWFAAGVYALAIWPGIQLNSTERAQVLTTFAATQGRTL